LLLLASVAVNHAMAMLIAKRRRTASANKLLALALVLNLLASGLFKYANFFITGIAPWIGVAAPVLKIILPIGISFYPFTQKDRRINPAAKSERLGSAPQLRA
jgi:alginate O-acetyltransferase complex protein AlgI